MAPGGGGKRKRGDRTFSSDSRDESNRPSPHRPDNLSLAQRTQQPSQPPQYGRGGYNDRGRGSRRGSRGGHSNQRSPIRSPNAVNQPQRSFNSQVSPTHAQPSTPSEPKPSAAPSTEQPDQASVSQVEEQPEKKPKRRRLAYFYEYLTDDVLSEWESQGRLDFESKGQSVREAEDSFTLSIIFQEILQAAIDARIDPKDAGTLVKGIIGGTGEEEHAQDPLHQTHPNFAFDPASLFLDTLSILAESTPEAGSLGPLIEVTGIHPNKMRLELDSALLESFGLIRSTFVRVGIRQQTNLLYRQSNYNLLREETEGYSKLITEFFTTSNNEPPTSEVVGETFEKVKGMIGAFDLDVGRVLDITLDVFAAVLVKQYRFFVKYLRASSWWPQSSQAQDQAAQHNLGPLPKWALPGFEGGAVTDEEREDTIISRSVRDADFWTRCKEIGLAAFFELGGRRVEDSTLKTALNKSTESGTVDEDEDRKWIETTKTLPPTGNKVAAQVLGFKLRFYTSSARDPSDNLPVNLIYLAALLIKVGFISLRDLYPHIWPEDPDMEKVKEDKMKEKAEKERLSKPGGGTNALLAAGALPDDTPEGQAREAARLREAEAMRRHQRIDAATNRSTPAVQPEEKTEELPEPADQKVQLLRSLLAIGALPEAFYMLGRFPWLPDAFPDLPIYIHRILHHCLTVVYDRLRPLQDEPALRAELPVLDLEQAGAPRGSVRQEKLPPRKTLKWAQLDKDDVGEMIDYKFYWDDWADVIPVCQTVDDVFSLSSTLLNFTGLKIGQDPMLMIKIARIGSHSLASDPSDANMTRWIDLSKRILVPALSLSKCNPALVNEVFELLKNFPEATRYNIYAEWYNGQTSRLPDIKAAFEQTKAETRDVLKRISKTTIKPMARALAKVSYTSPGIVFSVALSQLEAYDNIVDTFVECGRYFTFLGYDILTWSLMSALGAQGRNRLQADGLLTSKWLAVLSLFAGKIFKRFAAMNPLPIVQYVEYQLRKGNPEELVVLESMIRSMAGVISDVSFNEAQINAMSGGELLQSLTVQQLLDKRHEMKTAAKRLVKPLTESKLAGQLLVSLAQERQVCIFRVDEESAHPKLLGNVYDQIHRILGQYVELLRSSLSVKEFDLLVPDVTRLIAEFHIEPGVAFWISRPSVNAAVREFDTKQAEQQSQVMDVSKGEGGSIKVDVSELTPDKASEDATMAIDNEDKPAEESISTAKPEETNGVDVEMDILPNGAATSNEVSTQSEDPKQPGHPILEEIAAAIRTSLPEQTWTVMSPSFYTLFWQLSLGDVMISLESYHEETRRLLSRIKAINSDKTDPSISGASKRQKEVRPLQEYHDGLMIEMKERIKTKTSAPWRKYKDHWFAGAWQQFDGLNVALIEHCLFPRLVMSPVDAMYTFRMIRWLHGEGAMNFRTMGVYDQFFKEKRLTSMIFLCSAKEAECLGHFIREVLKDLSTWHAKKSFYEKEAYGPKRNLPGFAKALTSEKEVKSFLEFEDFRRILLKWHRNLNGALKTCYASGEYMHIRNAINILNHIHQYFPVVNWMGTNQLAGITELSKRESREDLKIAATSLIGALKKREKSWVLPQAFNLIEGNQQAAVNGARSNSARPGTPQTNGDKSANLNPKAPEFRPSPQPTSNNAAITPKPTQSGPDAEDGEIEDAQTTDIANQKESNQPRDTPSQQTTEPTLTPAITSKPAPAEVPLKPDTVAAKPPVAASTTPSQPSKPPSVPNRPDMNRSSSANMPNGHHDLPSRPEPPQLRRNDGRLPQKPDDRLPPPTSRESRLQGRNGADGARDAPSSRPFDRSAPSIGPRADDRLGRPPFDDGYGRPLPRDSRAPPIDDRLNRPLGNRVAPGPEPGRREFGSGPHPRDTGMGPPISSLPPTPVRGAINTEAAPLNPARAALIHGHAESDREPHSRYHGERSVHHESDRRSRGSSPVRPDDRRPMYDDRRPHQESRNGFDERLSHGRYDDSRAPTGPRTDRPSGPPSVAGDRFRDGMRPPTSSAPPIESNHGRPRQDPRQSESYGRLNNNPEYNDVPSGPRMPNGNSQDSSRHGRNINGPPQGMNNQQNSMSGPGPIPPSQARTAPGGPGSGPRSSPRSQPPAPTTNDSSPADATSPAVETTGIHPDRLKAMQGSAAPPQSSGPLPPNRGPPSNRPPPPPISATPAGPPRGPNNQAQSPIGPSPTNRGPPTGPADRGNNNRSDKRFTGLQSVLQQNTQSPPSDRSNQGTSIRGRGGRANNSNIPSPSASGPPTPSLAPRNDPFPPSRNDDLFAGRASAHPNTAPDEDARYGNGRGPPMRGPPPPEPERRSTRHGGGHRDRSPPPMSHGHSHGDHRPPPMPMRDDDRLPPPGGSGNPMRDRFRNEPHGGPPAGMNIRGNAQGGDFRGGPGPGGPNTGGGGGGMQQGGGGGGGDMGRDFRSRDGGGGGGGYDRGPRGPPGGGGGGGLGARNGDDGGGGGSLRKRGRPPGEDTGYNAGAGEKRPRR